MGQSLSALQVLRTSENEDEVVQAIVADQNIDVSTPDDEGRTALHWAAAEGKLAIAGALLDKGLSVNVQDSNLATPLITASFKNQHEMVKFLLSKGAEINAQDITSMTALHWATRQASVDCIEVLLDSGADSTIKNDRDQTAPELYATLKRAQRALVEPVFTQRNIQLPEIIKKAVSTAANGTPPASPAKESQQHSATNAKKVGAKKKPASSTIVKPIGQSSSAPVSVNRLAHLGTLWGLIKYTHPYIAHKNDIDWDKAVLEAISIAMRDELSSEDYREVVQLMLSQLNDPNTRALWSTTAPTAIAQSQATKPVSPKPQQNDAADTPSTGVAPTEGTPTRQLAPSSGPMTEVSPNISVRTQPYVDVTHDRVAIVVATDYDQFGGSDKLPALINAFTSAANSANAIVFDIRCARPGRYESRSAIDLSFFFLEAFKLFITEDLCLPSKRQRMFTGLPEHRRGFGQASVFHHGFNVEEADVLRAQPYVPPGSAAAAQPPAKLPVKPMSFLINSDTPQVLIELAIALKSRGLATFVYQVEDFEYRIKKAPQAGGNSPGEVLIYEPGITATVYNAPQWLGDEIRVLVRQTERVNPDGTVGFLPDTVVTKSIGSLRAPVSPGPSSAPGTPGAGTGIQQPATSTEHLDPALKAGIDFVTGRRPTPRPKPSMHALYSTRKTDDEYATMELPAAEYRVLALFRLWNAVQFFFAYKHLLNKPWDKVLVEYIPKFLTASTPLEYALAISEVVSALCDTHAYVKCNAIASYVGTHTPPIKIAHVDGKPVITQIMIDDVADPAPDAQVAKIGDIILSIDGVPVSERQAKLAKVYSASTPQGSQWRIDWKLLAGSADAKAVVEVERLIPSAGKYERVQLELQRTIPSHIQIPRDGPLYKILKQTDYDGGKVAYIDLTRLQYSDVDHALEAAQSANSLVLDMRGYTKGTVYRLGPILGNSARVHAPVALGDTPLVVPTMLMEDMSSGMIRQVQPSPPVAAMDQHFTSHKFSRVCALVNEDTLSHGEFSVSFLKAIRPDLVVVGKKTNGIVGNITNIVVPGGVVVGFTCMGLSRPDGESIQRRGIMPDILVKETVPAVVNGTDQILDAAVLHLQLKKKKPIVK